MRNNQGNVAVNFALNAIRMSLFFTSQKRITRNEPRIFRGFLNYSVLLISRAGLTTRIKYELNAKYDVTKITTLLSMTFVAIELMGLEIAYYCS